MKCLFVLFAVAAVGSAQLLISPLGHLASPLALRTQYHAQNELGQYSFGHAGGPNSRVESSSHGVTQGGFSYVDAHGLVQSRNYVADPVNGFRVAGTDIPVDSNTPLALSAAGVTPLAGLPSHPIAYLGRRKRSVYAYSAPLVSPVAPWAATWSHAAPLAVAHSAPLAVAAHPSAVLPQETPEVAAAKTAHLIQYNNEAVRNGAGVHWGVLGRRKRSVLAYSAPLGVVSPVAPWASTWSHAAPLAVAHSAPLALAAHPSAVLPQETPEVAAAKTAHLIQYNNEAVRNGAGAHWGVLGRRKRSVLAYSAPLGVVSPVAPWASTWSHAAPLAVAHSAPLALAAHPSAVLPQDTPEVAIAKNAHLIQYNNELIRNSHVSPLVLG